VLNKKTRGRGQEIRGRGAPVRGRGAIGRGRGIPLHQEPAYTFKAKEKEPVKESSSTSIVKDEPKSEPPKVDLPKPASKSIYETFMDVSSIFSNPIQSFGGESRGRSRFFNDTGDASSEDEYDKKLAD
jgi:hypothetical protein